MTGVARRGPERFGRLRLVRQLVGVVIHGAHLGRTLGFPTANLALPAEPHLRFGIYAGRVLGRPAAISVGVRPAIGGLEPLAEIHILDFSGDLYGQELTVELLEYLRPELSFPSLDALREQIARDVETVRSVVAARDADARSQLRAIADDCATTGHRDTSEVRLAEAYDEVRARAHQLNLRHGWMSAEEFGTHHPRLAELASIRALDLAWGPSVIAEAPLRDRYLQALKALGAWATGVRLAMSTFDERPPC